ncbi:hypothetical protein [Ktedonobacter racemifer]|uniref:hypothetical protein n=1 Tax=Ktedonobacter racemifer TaxID=363277 RepID=UPI001B7FEF0B|nr:hypothetical protein [Ktedonobacter racemifer]
MPGSPKSVLKDWINRHTISSPTVQYTYGRDYTFRCNQQISIGTLNGRMVLSYQGYEEHLALLRLRLIPPTRTRPTTSPALSRIAPTWQGHPGHWGHGPGGNLCGQHLRRPVLRGAGQQLY